MIADIVTLLRIVLSLAMLFFTPSQTVFVILYGLCGISDMFDGFLARKMHTESRKGEILDSIADLVFFAVAAGKILPRAALPLWIWLWVIAAAITKIAGIAVGSFAEKALFMPHTRLNKVTGALLFLGGIGICFTEAVLPAAVCCAFATFAAAEDLYLGIKRMKEN